MAPSKTRKMTHAARVLRIRELLDARNFVTVAGLRQEFGVSRRTVYNDIEALQDAGIPIYSEPGPDGKARWRIERAAKKQTITLAKGQVLPLAFARLALSFLEGTELHLQLSEVIDRLAVGLSPPDKEHMQQVSRKIAVVNHGPKSYGDQADVLDDLLSGLLYEQLVEISYRPPAKRARKHIIAPLTLVLYREALYLVAQLPKRERIATFAVDRIVSSTWCRGQRFDYPEDYAPEQVLDGSFGIIGGEPTDVELIFDARQAIYVQERQWHPTESFEALPEGRVRMRMNVRGLDDVLRWLLGHADAAEVVKPKSLRAAFRTALRKAVSRHGG